MAEDHEVIIDTGNVRVRIMKLAPGDMTPWHSHTQVIDTFFCLSGRLTVRTRKSEKTLTPGESCMVPAGEIHRAENPGKRTARYLLVQGVGSYDFLPVPGEAALP